MPEPFVIRPRTPGPASARLAAEASVDDGAQTLAPLERTTGRAEPLVQHPVIAEHPILAECWADERVTDLFINGAAGLFIDRGVGAERIERWAASEREVRELAVRLIALGGRHIDDQSPCVDVRLGAGVRVHGVLAPVATTGTSLSIRIPRVSVGGLEELAALGAFDEAQRRWLENIVHKRANVLITGGTGTGKTTLLAALLAHVPKTERIVTIEDVAELRPNHPHHVSLEARQANLEGSGGVSVSRLVRESLRMRPDRLVVGECRGEEVRDLLTALNTGHDGERARCTRADYPMCPPEWKHSARSPEWTRQLWPAKSSAHSLLFCIWSGITTASQDSRESVVSFSKVIAWG